MKKPLAHQHFTFYRQPKQNVDKQSKDEQQKEIDAQIEAFLAKGGEIEQAPEQDEAEMKIHISDSCF